MEILAPAGDYDQLVLSIKNGANAVYGGIKVYNARNKAKNFTIDEYNSALSFCRENNAKFYLTLNICMTNEDVYEICELMKKNIISIPDAIIISDIGLYQKLKKIGIHTSYHISTQYGAHNLNDIKYLESIGADRVILARELSLFEIEYIRKNTNMEIEVFIWGSQCMAFSGQCFFCSLLCGGSGNRGKCIALCRDKYSINTTQGDLLYPNDMNAINYASKLKNLGIDSLKIEGRRRPKEETVNAIRNIIKVLETNNDLIDSASTHSYLCGEFPVPNFISVDNLRTNKTKYGLSYMKKVALNKYNVSLELFLHKDNTYGIYIINDNGEGKRFVGKADSILINISLKDQIKKFENNIESLNIFAFKTKISVDIITIHESILQDVEKYLKEKVNAFLGRKSSLYQTDFSIEKLRVDIATPNIKLIDQIHNMGIREIVLEIDDFSKVTDEILAKDYLIFKIPYYFFDSEKEKNIASKLEGKKIMITRISQIDILKNPKRIECDYTINVWNNEIVHILKEKNVDLLTLNIELDLKSNLSIQYDGLDTELIVFGDIPLFSTRHCFNSNFCLRSCGDVKVIKNIDKNLDIKLICGETVRTFYYANKYYVNETNCSTESINWFRYITRTESNDAIIQNIQNLLNKNILEDTFYRNKNEGRK